MLRRRRILLKNLLTLTPHAQKTMYANPYLSNGLWMIPSKLILYDPKQLEEVTFDYKEVLRRFGLSKTVEVVPSSFVYVPPVDAPTVRLFTLRDDDTQFIGAINYALFSLITKHVEYTSIFYLPSYGTFRMDLIVSSFPLVVLGAGWSKLSESLKPYLNHVRNLREEEKERNLLSNSA
jgi:hypothetical protein